MRGIDIKAVMLATLAIFGVDFLVGVILFATFAEVPLDATEAQVRAAALELNRNASYVTTALVFGTASTVLGGYLVARMARSLPYFNALAFGVVGIVIGSLLSTDLPGWLMAVGFGLTIPAALLGAHLTKRAANS